jgi:hypothetical protein
MRKSQTTSALVAIDCVLVTIGKAMRKRFCEWQTITGTAPEMSTQLQ